VNWCTAEDTIGSSLKLPSLCVGLEHVYSHRLRDVMVMDIPFLTSAPHPHFKYREYRTCRDPVNTISVKVANIRYPKRNLYQSTLMVSIHARVV
jgi:hypothetical protein